MPVHVRERILAIRLMEKVKANPAYAEAVGIVAQNSRVKSKRKPLPILPAMDRKET